MPTTSVKFIASTQRGAPTLNGTAGTLLAVLDALFNTGWGPTTALSVNVSAGIATATLTAGETFERDAVVLIAGATPSALNGEAKVKTSSNTSITWDTTAPDGAATGTITIRYAPQTAWSKVYAATNKGAYRSSHVQSRGHYLRVDDTGTTTARVRGYESMTDVDTGIGPFPTDAQMSGGGYLWKAQNAGTTPIKYRIFCDERTVLCAIAAGYANGASYLTAPAFGFGDLIELAPGGDAWATFLSCGGSTISAAGGSSLCAMVDGGAAGLMAAPRAFAGLGGAVQVNPRAFVGTANSYSGSDTYLGDLPSSVDGQVKYSRVFLRDLGANKPPRGVVPGVLYIPQVNAAAALVDGDVLQGSGDFAGRKLLVVSGAAGQYNQSTTACYLVDITGPWR